MDGREPIRVTPPLNDVAFLVRSPNRMAVLRALADTTHSRRELVDETPASRVTVGRIIHDFDERGWVVRTKGGFEATRRGRLLARELSSLRDRLHGIERLEPVLSRFPVDRLDVPLEGFVDARVTVPTPTEPNRHHQRIGSVGAAADHARMYARGVTREALDIHRSAVEEADQRLEIVLTREAVEVVRSDEDLSERVHGLASTATVCVVDESLPVPFVALFDDLAFVGADDDGVPVGVVESDNEAVVAWVSRTLDAVLADATPIDLDTLTD